MKVEGDCRICGQRANGTKFVEWVRPTFTNFDALVDGDIICDACLFWFDESSEELAKMAGKDKPQRMRNYSHFIKNGEWTPLGKGDKKQMKLMLRLGHYVYLSRVDPDLFRRLADDFPNLRRYI